MEQEQIVSSTVNRFMTIFGVAALFLLGYVVFLWSIEHAPVRWSEENFSFTSGPHCFVFREPKLVVFLGDDGPEEIFNHIGSCGHSTGTNVNSFRSGSGGQTIGKVKVYSFNSREGKMTMQFLDGKCTMVVSVKGTKLTLTDGREFTLDGKTPHWFRCKSDGTIIELDELPEGFVEFFESPPPDPGMIRLVESYPEAFQK